MRTPAASEIVDLADAGSGLSPLRRALCLAQAAWPEAGDPAGWSMGLLNARLLELRMALFGPRLVCLANCPRCEAVAETEIVIRQLLAGADDMRPASPIETDGGVVTWRAPTPADVLQLADQSADLGQALLARVADAPAWTPALRATVEQRIAEHDPLAQIDLVLDCPACGARWSEPLHVIDVLWTELCALADRLVSEVVHLAHAFGWAEADVLAMSAQRRQRYLSRLAA